MKLPKSIAAVSYPVPRTAFNVVIVYDDFAAGRRAMDACKHLVTQLGKEVQFRSSMWKFDVLQVAKLNRIAVHDAIEADIIIVASGQSGDLPDEVKAWVESWVPEKRGQAAALLALIDFAASEDLDGLNLIRAYLEKAAADAQIDFLPQSIQSEDQRWEPSSGAAFEPKLPSGTMASRPAPEGWGLND